MKRLMSIAAAGIIIAACAADSMALELSAGVKGGWASAKMAGKDTVGAIYGQTFDCTRESRSGIAAGVVLNADIISLLGMLTVGAECDLLYSQKGETDKAKPPSATIRTYKFDYLDIPLLAKVKVSLPVPVVNNVVLSAGPSFNFLMSAEFTQRGSFSIYDGTNKKYDTVTKHFDMGMVYGAGTEIRLGPGKIAVDVRYNRGFSSVDDHNYTTDEISMYGYRLLDVKNSVWSVMAGYIFKLF